MADVGSLNYKVTADSTGLSTALAKSGDDIGRFAANTNKASAAIGTALGGVRGQVTNVFDSLTQSGPQAAIASLQSGITSLGSSIAAAFGPAGLAVGGLVAGFAAILSQTGQIGGRLENINRLSRVLSTSGRNTQILSSVFGEDAQGTLLRIQNRLGELRQNRNSPIADSLVAIGLDPDKIGLAPLRTAIQEIFEALKNTSDGVLRTKYSSEIFGRSYIELADSISKGRRAFERAAREVDLYGSSAETLRLVEENKQRRQERDANRPSFGRVLEREVNDIGPAISRAIGQALDFVGPITTVGIYRQNRFGPVSPDAIANRFGVNDPNNQNFQLDRQEFATRRANQEAQELLNKWQEEARLIGLSARQIEILKLQERGASEIELGRLRTQEQLEERAKREKEIRERITQQFERQRDISLAIVGISADSIEAAKIAADRQTRQNNGDQEETRQIAILLSIAEALQELNTTGQQTVYAIHDLEPIFTRN